MRARANILIVVAGLLSALVVFGVGSRRSVVEEEPAVSVAAPLLLVRDLPEAFPLGKYMPNRREPDVCGAFDPDRFSPGRDLVYVDDVRAWWESDNDKNDDECDHTVHAALRPALERLIGLAAQRGAVLKIQDAYRPIGIHHPLSLHREGRAIDVTCDDIAMEELAALAWAAGFDWVLHERGNRANGPHIHASVAR